MIQTVQTKGRLNGGKGKTDTLEKERIDGLMDAFFQAYGAKEVRAQRRFQSG